MSSKKPKPQPQQQMKAEMQRQKAIADQHKKKMMPIVKFLKKNNLRFNHARVGTSRIEYFRLDELQKLLSSHSSQIEANETLKPLCRQIRQQLVYFKRPPHIKTKYPNILEPVLPDNADKKFASFRFDTTESKKWMMVAIIMTVLSLVLFPIWPYELKYGIWLISFCLLVFLVGLIVFRLAIFLFCVIFGYNVWILPNLLGQYGLMDSLRPLIYYQKWDVSLYTVLIRVCVLSSIIAYGCYLYLHPEVIFENIQTLTQVTEDIHDWGVDKIKNQKNFSQRAITNLEVILNETSETILNGSSKGSQMPQSGVPKSQL